MGCKGCSKRQNNKLNTYDWLCDVPDAEGSTDFVEVQFKNTRKGYYLNSAKIPLEKGDIVAVEASPGHDIGTVSLTGKLVLLQMKKNNVRTEAEPKRIYRKAKPTDIEKYEEAKAKEHATMIRSRQIAADLGLNMKIGDVEYQGDGNKAIFYYIADERVDFRQLIKVLAEAFRVRIEMKQIGARQEAGRIGGIGPCGRELCCSSWMTSFVSVATGAARYQDISMNPQKLAGQCAKLKCCINYEVDTYVEAQKRLPSREIVLETKDNNYYHFKTDIFKREITYSTDKSFAANLITIPASRAFDVINMNKKGMKPISLEADTKPQPPKRDAQDILGQESVTRFDSVKKKKKKRPANKNNGENNGNGNGANTTATAVTNTDAPVSENKNNGGNGAGGNNRRNGGNNRNSNRENNRDRENNRENNKTVGRTTVIITGRTTETIARNKGRELITISNPTMTSLRIMTNLSNRSNRPDLIKRRIGQRQSLRLKKFIAACVTCFLCFSCENEAVYDQYQAIQNTSWEKNKEYYFTFLIEDISVPYDLTLEVRNNNMYPYQNLWVFCSEELPIGPLKRDTIECMLADEFGKWYGHGISLFQSSFPIRSAYYFPVKGQYTFSFRQGMRNDQLPGIQEIGLRVLPSSINAPSEKRPNEEK